MGLVLALLSVLVGSVLFAWGIAAGEGAPTLGGIVLIALGVVSGAGTMAMRTLAVLFPIVAVLAAVIPLMTRPQERAPVPAARQTPAGPGPATGAQDPAALGRQLASSKGCIACHSIDGSRLVGPTWKGLYGKRETLQDGGQVVVDDAYIRESILTPNAKVVQGFQPVMPQLAVSDQEMEAIIAYIRSLQ